jgi:hypothetical protein
LITAGSGIVRWPLARASNGGEATIRVGPQESVSPQFNAVAAQSVTGNALVIGSRSSRFVVHHTESPNDQVVLSGSGGPDWFAAVSPDGRWAALGRKHPPGITRVWNAESGEAAAEIPSRGGSLPTFSPDGRWLVLSTTDALTFYEVGSWQEMRRMRFEGQGFTQVAFSADMRLMAITSASDVSLMDAETGAPIANFIPPREAQFSTSYPEGASGICFCRDGSRLAAGSKDGLVFVWELAQIRRRLAALGLDWEQSTTVYQPVIGDIEPVRVEVVARPVEVGGAIHDVANSGAEGNRPALQFDGADDFVRLPTFPLGGELTIEAWVKNQDVRANYARILDLGYGRSSNNIILGWAADSGCMLWEIYNGGSSRNLRIVTSEAFPQDRWVHVAAVVKAGGEGTIYWDGNSIATGRIQVPERASRSVQYVGRSNWPGNAPFRGSLAELRIWNTARSPEAIAADRNRLLNGDEPNLVGYWRLDDGSGAVAADRAAGRRHGRVQGGAWQP